MLGQFSSQNIQFIKFAYFGLHIQNNAYNSFIIISFSKLTTTNHNILVVIITKGAVLICYITL